MNVTRTDYWREIVRSGVEALGFRIVGFAVGGPVMLAEVADLALIAGAPDMLTAAHAAMEMDKLIGADGVFTIDGQLRADLMQALGRDPASGPITAYQNALTEALWRAVADDPKTALEAMAEPHQ